MLDILLLTFKVIQFRWWKKSPVCFAWKHFHVPRHVTENA
jgi:hypothetical protein